MVAGNWLNNDNLYLQYGTSKAVATPAGEFKAYGEDRVIDIGLDLTTLTTSTATILGNTNFYGGGSNIIIDRVEFVVETAATSGSSSTLKVGLVQNDRATVPANYDHAFINGETNANMATVGDRLVYVGTDSIPAGSTHGGTLIGSFPASATAPYYITAQAGTAVFTAGKIHIRIYYRGLGTIRQ